jgi:hypothetical protein
MEGGAKLKTIQSSSLKTMTWILLFSSFIYFILAHFPIPAYACDCVIPPSVETELSQSDAVFSGKVISIKKSRSTGGYAKKEIIFEVYQTWKGVEESQVKIITGQGGGDCGYHFVPDGEYLVYGRYSDMYGKSQLSTGICDRTVDLGAANEDLKILGNGVSPVKQVDIVSNDSSEKLFNMNFKDQNWIIYFIVFIVFFIGIFGFTTWRNMKKS